jgi:hypothetical protein
LVDAALLSLCILYLHRVPGAAPAAGSCRYAAAGNFCGNSGREARLDYGAVDSVALHLHSIADAEHVPSIVMKIPPQEVLHGSSCGKKIKKDLTSIITWDIKGVLTRKTKGK